MSTGWSDALQSRCNADARQEEAAAFWRRDLPVALGDEAARLLPHLGLCADLCHLAVAGDDPAGALARRLAAEAREALAAAAAQGLGSSSRTPWGAP